MKQGSVSSFLITEKDYVNMSLERLKYITPTANKIFLTAAGMLAIVTGSSLFIFYRGGIFFIICQLILIVAGLYMVSYSDVINPYITRTAAVKYYRYYQKSIFSKTVIISDDTIKIRDESHSLVLTGDMIFHIAEGKYTIFIYTDPGEFTFIPKRAMSEEQMDLLKKLIPEDKVVRI